MTKAETIKQLENLKEHCDDMSRGNSEIWQDDTEALETAIAAIDTLDKVQAFIEIELVNLRKYNTKLNYASDFQMTHEIATTSGKICGLKMALHAIEECLGELREDKKCKK